MAAAITWGDVEALGQRARLVRAYGDGGQPEGPMAPTYFLKHLAVTRVATESLVSLGGLPVEDRSAALDTDYEAPPQRTVDVKQGSAAPMLAPR